MQQPLWCGRCCTKVKKSPFSSRLVVFLLFGGFSFVWWFFLWSVSQHGVAPKFTWKMLFPSCLVVWWSVSPHQQRKSPPAKRGGWGTLQKGKVEAQDCLTLFFWSKTTICIETLILCKTVSENSPACVFINSCTHVSYIFWMLVKQRTQMLKHCCY